MRSPDDSALGPRTAADPATGVRRKRRGTVVNQMLLLTADVQAAPQRANPSVKADKAAGAFL
jgi:hypothetical protein